MLIVMPISADEESPRSDPIADQVAMTVTIPALASVNARHAVRVVRDDGLTGGSGKIVVLKREVEL